MPITNLPDFVNGQLLTAAQLNQIVNALQTKFGGNITGADLVWPLQAQGDIDFVQSWNIDGLRTFWEVINVTEYDSLGDAVAALPTGGGAIFVPPDTTVTADGVEVTKPVYVYGAGKTSVLRLTSGATSGYLLRAQDTSNFTLANLTIDGNSDTGSGQDGVQIRNVDGAMVRNCRFQDFSGDALYIGNNGSAGNSSTRVIVSSCQFDDGGADHIAINDVDGCTITHCQFNNATGDGIEAIPTGASSLIRSLLVANNQFDGCNRSVYVEGQSATPSNGFRLVKLIGNESLTTVGVPFTLGAASAELREIVCIGNIASSTSADAFNIKAQYGIVQGNYARAATNKGLDMSDCDDLYVEGNGFPDSGDEAIDASSSTNCRIINNDVHKTGGTTITKTSATGLVVQSNHGHHDATVGTIYADTPVESVGVTVATEDYTIPANTVKVGDVIRLMVRTSTAAADPEFVVSLDGGTTELTVADYSAAGQSVGIVELLVEALSGAGSTTGTSIWTANNGQIGSDDAQWAADWTADVTISFENKASTLSFDYYSVEILGGTS